MNLEGRVAIVTGASGGIGRVLCTSLAAAGADVVLAGRDQAAMESVAASVTALGRHASVVRLDLTSPGSVAAGVAAAGPIDVAVSNSGISGPVAPLWDYPLDDWRNVIDTNLTGAFLFCRAVLGGMVSRRSGSVVVIGSMAGKRPSPGRGGYSTSKAGLITLVRTMAIDAGPFGIRANLISPGAVTGGNLDGIIKQNAASSGLPEETVLAGYREAAPMKELVEPEDIARAAVFLASDDAAHITGADLNVTAGLVMH